MERLIEMLERAYALALLVQDDNRDERVLQAGAEEVSGECGEFLALFDGDMAAFGDAECTDESLIALVEKLKGQA